MSPKLTINYNKITSLEVVIELIVSKRFDVFLQQAMEEKYKVCDDALQKLLNWVTEVENTICQQDVVKEDSEQLRNQINTVKVQ